MNDLVERLRGQQSPCQDMQYTAQNALQDEAADEIERLTARVDQLTRQRAEIIAAHRTAYALATADDDTSVKDDENQL